MKRNTLYVKGLLVAVKEREEGSMVTPEGREIHWDAGLIVYLIPEGLERGSITKYTVHPKCAKEILSKTADIGWGAYCQLSVEDGMVVDLTLILDAYADLAI